MAFKSMKEYTEERTGDFFLLRNDGDFADVVFLYRDYNDVMAASVHYIKSADYSGYVHCQGRGCPACARNIRVQNKLFIPMYVFAINNEPVNKVAFWDRNVRFNQTLMDSVFTNYPNPSTYIFRITRRGAAGDMNTTYDIVIQGISTTTYSDLLKSCGLEFPDSYSMVCKDVPITEMNRMFNSSSSAPASGASDLPSYSVIPRSAPAAAITPPPMSAVPGVEFSGGEEEVGSDLTDELGDPVF